MVNLDGTVAQASTSEETDPRYLLQSRTASILANFLLGIILFLDLHYDMSYLCCMIELLLHRPVPVHIHTPSATSAFGFGSGVPRNLTC